MHRLSKTILLGLITCTAGFSDEVFCAQEADATARLVRILDSLQTLHAEFSHEAAPLKTQRGEIWLSKPDLFRVETAEPMSQTIVSDGVSMWTHDRDLEQVIISPLNNRVDEMPILLFSGEPEAIAQNYSIEFFEVEQIQRFLLTPFITPIVSFSIAVITGLAHIDDAITADSSTNTSCGAAVVVIVVPVVTFFTDIDH